MKKQSVKSLKIIKQQYRAIALAKRRLRRQLEDIEWRETALADALDDIDAMAAAGELPEVKLTTEDDLPRLLPGKK